MTTWFWVLATLSHVVTRIDVFLGLAKTVYTHSMWPYVQLFSLLKLPYVHRVCFKNVWFWPACRFVTPHSPLLYSRPHLQGATGCQPVRAKQRGCLYSLALLFETARAPTFARCNWLSTCEGKTEEVPVFVSTAVRNSKSSHICKVQLAVDLWGQNRGGACIR